MNDNISPERNIDELENSNCNSTNHGSETLEYYSKLKNLATHLADICSVTIKQQDIGIYSEENSDFANLVANCANEITGLGEYLLDLANQNQ